jgi:gamma-glutamyltranspeptidase/glutathione hydrolase
MDCRANLPSNIQPAMHLFARPSPPRLGGLLLLALSFSTAGAQGPLAHSDRGVIATVHPLASKAGQQAFRSGGNAVDAAIAAALTLGVVDSHNSGLGGGCFILIRDPQGQFLAIDGRETAPAAATRDMYMRGGNAVPDLSQNGPLAVAVPGALAAHAMALQRAGRLSLPELLRPAAEIAQAGHPIDRVMADNLLENIDLIRRFPATSRVLLRENSRPHQEGEILLQSDLAMTYRAIADQGLDWFYGGPFANLLEHWMSQHGGLITADDLRSYRAREREPIVTSYRQYTIVGFPPPSSGGVHVAQILNILECFDLRSLYQEDPTQMMHVVAEAMKLAFADRAYWLGDSDFVDVPQGLIGKKYARRLAQKISLDHVFELDHHGVPDDWQSNTFGKHTTHIAAADRQGYWVAITATVNTSFGSKVMVPGTGLLLNNEMDDFSAQPGTPNAFGLLGSKNNAIEPGKRPLSSMSPTIVLRDGRPVLTLGAAGGPKIISQIVLAIIQALDLRMPLDQSIGASRWHHQWHPDRLMVEASLESEWIERLTARGHEVEILESAGVMQAIMCDAAGQFLGASDPRVPGEALGF